ncbi:hypothetical protein FB566_5011 [Stackebrandtia endophytica]|uniref:Transmembrane protein n=1 Tax=Stackebrandtia endophytica TaxID=1496996 RepID=A0A543B3K7_9ACTN|nr:hypothetical protein [Stackebrandtia endophytica]TQL79406.1 hypothetical protein FB566_5011 [Stackebrandtia endophytica]
MSITTPAHATARGTRLMPLIRTVLWSASALIAFAIPFWLLISASSWWSWPLTLLGLPVIFTLGVGLTDLNTDNLERQARYVWPYLMWAVGLVTAAAGAGLFAGFLHQFLDFDRMPLDPVLWPLYVGTLLATLGGALLITSGVVRMYHEFSLEKAKSI